MKSKRMLCTIIFIICVATFILSGCGKKEIVYELKGYTVKELQPDTYYVQHGDLYYPVAKGELTVENHGEEIAKEANPDRAVWYTLDECMIPTMYQNDSLVYVTKGGVPTSFVWERFEDEGFSIGVKGLKKLDSGNYATIVDKTNINLQSSCYPPLKTLSGGSELMIDKVGGTTKLTEANVSRCGSITGLEAYKNYTIDFYSGTQCITQEVTADTHIFGSFELYQTSNYAFDNAGFIRIEVPDYFLSGYYYINGAGLFKYVDNSSDMGIINDNFNAPYYLGKDEKGNVITVDNQEFLLPSDENTEVETVEDEKKFVNSMLLDCTQEKMVVSIVYSEETDDVVAEDLQENKEIAPGMEDQVAKESLPRATITNPEGTTYEFVKDERLENALTFDVDCPLTGEWVIEITNMGSRTFTIDTDFTSGHSDSVIHTGTGKVQMKAYIDKTYNDGVIKFNWENKDRGAQITVTTPDNRKYGSDGNPDLDIQNAGYGQMDIYMGYLEEGNYTFEVSGEDLGRIRYQVVEAGATAVQEKVQEEEVTEEESSEEGSEETEETENAEQAAE